MQDPTHAQAQDDSSIFVIVAARQSRRESLRALIASIEPRCCVQMVPSIKELASLPVTSPLNLAVFDLEFETSESVALMPLLAKRRPDTAVVALYNAVQQAPIGGRHIWPWQQAEKALRLSLHGLAARTQQPANAATVNNTSDHT
jgi:hypothetical protein